MIQRPAVPRVEKIREEVSTKLSTDSTTSSASTTSSTSSVVRPGVDVMKLFFFVANDKAK
jgi:hypothetical protein